MLSRTRAIILCLLVLIQVFLLFAEASGAPVITRIRIEGLERVDRASVERALQIREGDPFQESLVTRSIRSLYRLGTFSRVAISAEEDEPGLVLTVRVEEFPLVKDIVFDLDLFCLEIVNPDIIRHPATIALPCAEFTKDTVIGHFLIIW